jgi:serpin B
MQPNLSAASVQTVDPKLIEANTRFGFKLFSQLLKQENGQNVFVSPSSVAIALAMTYNGANGATQQAMAQTLELQGMSLAQINQANANLRALLTNPEAGVQLAIANSIWAEKNFQFQPDFIQRNQQFYAAQVENVAFSDPTTNALINNWVKANTKGKISEIVPDKGQLEYVMLLLNAIYFKGDWKTPFDRAETTNKPFSVAPGQTKRLPMMSQTGRYAYYETDRFQAVSLPYGQGRVSMYVFLPKANVTAAQFAASITADTWQDWMKQFRSRPGSIQLPRFKLEYETKLNDTLTALGMGVAFSNQADFSGLSRGTKIDEVKHKTFVEVNEKGTEAAAVTSVGIARTSAQVEPPFEMVVDRPFFCAIRDNQTGTLLFMGSIVEPQ